MQLRDEVSFYDHITKEHVQGTIDRITLDCVYILNPKGDGWAYPKDQFELGPKAYWRTPKMIDPKHTNDLFNAVVDLVDAVDYGDVLEIGGEPLQNALTNANELLDKIGDEIQDEGGMKMTSRTRKTTRQHFEKYRDMAKAAGVTLKNSTSFGTKEELERKFDADHLLNNIPLRKFDGYFYYMRRAPNGPRSLAENCCMYKHLLIYEIIGATPEFTD